MSSRIQQIEAHFDHHDLIQIQEMPDLKRAVFRLARQGRLTRILPGIYAPTDRADQPRIRMAALHLRDPDVVFTGLTAAGLLWDAKLLPATVEGAGRLNCAEAGFAVRPRRIDPEWISELEGGSRVTNPVLTAVDLIPREGGRFVDQLLRASGARGADVLDQMWAAFRAHPRRPGNDARAELLRCSRTLPWSEAERLAHQHLLEAGITGWLTNHPIKTSTTTYFADVALPAIALVVEFDGFEFHSSRAAFEHDRARQNAIVTAGWQVLRFTWAMIENGTWLVDLIRFIELHPHGDAVLP